ncbi:MAG: hypothetical protein KF730_17265 [Sphingomonas sp.]|uniref:hypothetical protein n=1 Tax=Sphingomonas sp. TaxID=28214 RepID=UPI0025CF4917|nr:hypothetical protein [Sphingomonas sp.]MBX3566312.1 hypothetical protein [Sphingomonas sp.]
MSALDRRLLEVAGLTASGAAAIISKSRQAVAKGIRGETAYFGETDLRLISENVGNQSPVLRERFLEAIEEDFGDLANRLRAATATSGLMDAIAGAKRIWLILPDFVQSRLSQPQAYDGVIKAIKGQFGTVDVIAFCDRLDTRTSIEREFMDEEWFETRSLAITQCDLVALLLPMVVVNPHQNPRCYVLSQSGFVDLSPHEAAGRVNAFSAAVTNKFRQAPVEREQPERRPFNLLVAEAKEVLDARVEKTDFALFG